MQVPGLRKPSPALESGRFLADHAFLGALDQAASGHALVAHDLNLLDFRAAGAALGELQNLDLTRARLAAVLGLGIFLFRNGAPQHEQFTNVLNGCGIELVAQLGVHRFAGFAVVTQHANLDQAVRLEGGIGFLQDRRGEAIAADHDDRVQVVRISPVDFALGSC